MSAKSPNANYWHHALGKAIRQERVRQARSQEWLADRARIHSTQISNIECGNRNPTYLAMRRISIALGVPLAELIKRGEELEWAEPASVPEQAGDGLG